MRFELNIVNNTITTGNSDEKMYLGAVQSD